MKCEKLRKIMYLCTMILYFSGTGNTRWAAQRLAETTGERVLFIPDELKTDCRYTLENDERIGFCFPVHGWQPPRIVREFARKLFISDVTGHFAYALCTCGDSIGLAMDMFAKELEPKGILLHAALSLVMPESYVCLPFMYTDTLQREQEKILASGRLLDDFCNQVKQRKPGSGQLVKGVAPWAMSHIIGSYFNSHMITDRKFTVDEDVCLHCGLCAKECPVSNIDFSGGQPRWRHNGSCTCCLGCYHRCPVHAINYGRITRQRGQYYFGKNR